MPALVQRRHEPERQGCGQPQHRLRRLHHHLRRWTSREFYRICLSANTTGISVYVLGLEDKTYLARTYSASIGKASVTGYCIKFKRLSLINDDALQAAIRYGMTVDKRPGPEPTRP